MTDYIDRDAPLEKIKKWYCSKCKTDDHCHACWADDMRLEIEDMPAVDAVKVVRCKDCAYSKPNPRKENQRWCDVHMKMMYDDEFCSRGVIEISGGLKNDYQNHQTGSETRQNPI